MKKGLYGVFFGLFLLGLIGQQATFSDSQTHFYEEEARYLQGLGLFLGTDEGFELDRAPTRLEALVILIRLLGDEQQAKESEAVHPFLDVPSWGEPYVAYAYEHGLTFGVSETLFGSLDLVSEAMFITFVLRALGYDDSIGDFHWSTSRDKGIEVGIVDLDQESSLFLRDHCVGIAFRALQVPLNNQELTLEAVLVEKGVIEASSLEMPSLEIPKVIWQGTLVGLQAHEAMTIISMDVITEAFANGAYAFASSIYVNKHASRIEDFYKDLVSLYPQINDHHNLTEYGFYYYTWSMYPTIYVIMDGEKQILAYAIDATVQDGYMWFETADVSKHSQNIEKKYASAMANLKSLTRFSPNRIDLNNPLPMSDAFNNLYYPIDLSDYQNEVFIVRYGMTSSSYDNLEAIFDAYFMLEQNKYVLDGYILDPEYDFEGDDRFHYPKVMLFFQKDGYQSNLFFIMDRSLNIVGYMIVDTP